MNTMMKCCDVIGFLDDYIDGSQPADVRAAFERHLAACPKCVDYMRTYQESIKLCQGCYCKEELSAAAPPELRNVILAAVLELHNKQRQPNAETDRES